MFYSSELHMLKLEITITDYLKQTPEQKLVQSLNLYHSALQLKIAALKQRYPQKSEAEITDIARRIFFNAK